MAELTYHFDDLLVTCTKEILTNGLDSKSVPSTIRDWVCGQVVKSLPSKLLHKLLKILLDNKDSSDFIYLKENNFKNDNQPDQMVLFFYKSFEQKKRLEEECRLAKLKQSSNFIGGADADLDPVSGLPKMPECPMGFRSEDFIENQDRQADQAIITQPSIIPPKQGCPQHNQPKHPEINLEAMFRNDHDLSRETFKFYTEEMIVDYHPEKNKDFRSLKSVNFPKTNPLESEESDFLGSDLDFSDDYNSSLDEFLPSKAKKRRRTRAATAREKTATTNKKKAAKQNENLGLENAQENNQYGPHIKTPESIEEQKNRYKNYEHSPETDDPNQKKRLKMYEYTDIANATPELIKDPGEAGRYTCKLCEARQFNTAREAVEHVNNLHKNNKNTYCTICDKRFTTPRGYKTHMMKHMGIKGFKCEVCHIEVTTAYTLVNHKKSKHPEVYAQQYAEYLRVKEDRKANPLKYRGQVVINPLTHKMTTKFSEKPMKYRYDRPYEKEVRFDEVSVSSLVDRVVADSKTFTNNSGADGYSSKMYLGSQNGSGYQTYVEGSTWTS